MDSGLYKAITSGGELNTTILKQFKSGGLFKKTPTGNTILHLAVLSKRLPSVKLILRHHSQFLLSTNKMGDTALHLAARHGLFEIAATIIAFVVHNESRSIECFANIAGETPLYLAAKTGNDKLVNLILDNCSSCCHWGPQAMNPLHAAVFSNNFEVTSILLANKSDWAKEGNESGWTPLHYAAYLGFKKRVDQLLKGEKTVAYLTDKNGQTALHIAASKGDLGIIKVITDHCPDTWEMRDNTGKNFLHITAIHKQHKVLEYVLESGNMVEGILNEPDDDGNTPLHLSVIANDKSIIKLLAKNVLINKKIMNKENMAALHISKKMSKDFWGDDDNNVQYFKELITQLMVVAALISTVTFTLGLSLPGGFQSDGADVGMSTLTRVTSYKVFLISNTMAMLLSTSSLLIFIWVRLIRNEATVRSHTLLAYVCILTAMVAMVVAFITGSYAVLNNSAALAISICVLCVLFFPFVLYLLNKNRKEIAQTDLLDEKRNQKRKTWCPTIWGAFLVRVPFLQMTSAPFKTGHV